MNDIREIQQELSHLYQAFNKSKVEVPPSQKVNHWIRFAEDFISAASIIADQDFKFILPRLQITGQAVELALKACLIAARENPPTGNRGHDLVYLYDKASKHGFDLARSKMAAIVHLSHFYSKDLATGTPYKARYPADTTERLGGSVPDHSEFESLVRSLIEQAKEKNQ